MVVGEATSCRKQRHTTACLMASLASRILVICLMKNVKLEQSFEPRVIQYMIELYSEFVIKLFDIGVTNTNMQWPL
jgi:hypothetical protein